MSTYLNDPREMAIRPESGITLEEDNRYEEMWHWGAAVLDLCNLPVEEYMKPMTVNVNGGGGGEGGGGSESASGYTLKFILNGSTYKTYRGVEAGAPISTYLPSDIDTDKYNFSGWADANGNEVTTMPESNLTLYATSEIKKFKVTFEIDGIIDSAYTQTVEYGKKATRFPASAKTGYDFSGWEPAASTVITADTKFVGSFTKKSYTLTFKISADTEQSTVEFDSEIVYPASDSKVGYTICGWTPTGYTKMPASNLTLTAVLSANSYSVRYLIDNGEGADMTTVAEYVVKFGATIPSVAVPIASGYSFTPWSADTEIIGNKMPASNVDFVTVKSSNEYSLTYFIDNEKVSAETYTYGAAVIPASKYEREGYTTTEWVFEPSLNEVAQELGGGYSMPYYNVSASCQTSINSYNVIIRHDDEVVFSGSVEYGTEISTLIPEGYSYSGQAQTVPSEDVSIEVSINSYNVVVTLEGKEPFTLELEYKSDIESAIVDYIEENYPNEMIGHHVETNVPDGATVPASDVAYTAEIVPNAHTASISGVPDVVINYGENIVDSLEDVVSDLGIDEFHEFKGWEMNGQPLVGTETMPDEDITLTPIIEVKKSSVVNVVSGQTDQLPVTYDYGTPISEVIEDISENSEMSEEINDPGYDVQWTVNGSAYTPDMVVKEDELTVEAQINPKPFMLSFLRRGTAAAADGVIKSGETLYKEAIIYPEMPAEIEISGVTYEFKWDEGSVAEGTPMPSSAVTVYGEYVEKPVVKTIYYGALNHDVITAITNDSQDVLGLNSFADFPADGKFPIVIPADPTYNDHYDNDTDEEFDAYLKSAAREPIIVAPLQLDLSEYSGLRGGLQPVVLTKAQNIKINGADYTVWYEFRIDEEYPAAHGYFSEGKDKSLEITLTK